MKLHTKTLSNGLRLQAIEMPGTNVITTLILAGAGSRYETQSERGISHFLEHMFFKGAEKYKTPKEVSMAVDSFGGAFNAFTGKEYAGYYVKCGKENHAKAIDVLADMLLRSRFEPAEIEKERGVILEEMAMYLDAPMYQISWDFEALAFGDQSLGWDQIGTKELINGVTQDDFKAYQAELYTPDNIVITVAGAVNEQTLDDLVAAFLFPDEKKKRQFPVLDEAKTTKKVNHRVKKTEQYHIAFGVRAVAESDEKYAALKVLGVLLGGNMSSRMFQNVREQKGLCYSIHTLVEEFTDTGLMVTRAGVKKSDVLRAVAAIRHEYEDVAQNGVNAEELKNAVNYLRGKTDLKTEDTESVAHHFAKQALLYNSTKNYADWKAKLAVVTKEQVDAIAKELLHTNAYRLAVIGDDMSVADLEKELA